MASAVPAAVKLLTGLAGVHLLASAAFVTQRQSVFARLGTEAAAVLAANGVSDGAARWTDAEGHGSRLARLSGTADAATRARIAAQLAARPGIAGVVWQDRR
ncbi:hypothetical protein [Sandarakinorhabdus sp. DWP1-3-1]|uniref:hypothetical protein n=1 Tax=Sandarakinorhabdus sp. DWP1-3-1 TaxID=2804627 RepID=UPI003CF0C33F